MYTITDLSTVWIELELPPAEAARLRRGQAVHVAAGREGPEATTTIAFIAPVGDSETQRVRARAELPNPAGAWRPGLFVEAAILVEEIEVPVAVAVGALQTFRDWDVVFVTDGRVFQAIPVELGRRDDARVEITKGLQPGARYAASGSFVVKADVEKSGAMHGH
jgi:cobalt-zinc-cadmium efflux system membrane fusion protein